MFTGSCTTNHLTLFPSQLLECSSSSPLLSLVQVPAKLAINLSIHTQHTYDNGVDRTGDRVFRKIQLLHEEREEEKKKIFNPQTMLHLEYSLRTEKKNTSAQKHIYHKHMTLQQGETYPALASSHPVQCHLFRRRSTDLLDRWRYKAFLQRQLNGGGE